MVDLRRWVQGVGAIVSADEDDDDNNIPFLRNETHDGPSRILY
jgi:endogenous inhibitor of DNA gyrase (YacG/DUF329 family)